MTFCSPHNNIPWNLAALEWKFYLWIGAFVAIFYPTVPALANNPSSNSHQEDYPWRIHISAIIHVHPHTIIHMHPHWNEEAIRWECPKARWLGVVVVRVSDSWSRGRGFDTWPAHRQATTLGMLPTPMCLCHQAVQFGTGQRAVMLCGREGLASHWPCITDFSGLSTYGLIKAGDVVRAAQATDGLARSAGTTTTYHQLICGGDPSCEVIRGWRYGPCRLCVNDDDDGLKGYEREISTLPSAYTPEGHGWLYLLPFFISMCYLNYVKLSYYLQCKFMPFTGDCHMVTCAREGHVRLAELSSTGTCKTTRKLAQHHGAAHKVSVCRVLYIVYIMWSCVYK